MKPQALDIQIYGVLIFKYHFFAIKFKCHLGVSIKHHEQMGRVEMSFFFLKKKKAAVLLV